MCLALLSIPIGLIHATTSRNVLLRPNGSCIPCPDSFTVFGGTEECPHLCVDEELEDAFRKACGPPAKGILEGADELGLGGEDVPPKDVIQLLAHPALAAFFPGILAVAICWALLLSKCMKAMVYATVVLGIGTCGYVYWLTQNWMMLLVGVAIAAAVISQRRAIDRGCECTASAMHALKQTRHAGVVLVGIKLVSASVAAMMYGAIIAMSQVFAVTPECTLEVEVQLGQVVFAFIGLLAYQFFTMVACYCLAFAIGCWYYHHGDAAAPAAPIVMGLRLAVLTANGLGVCTQAGVVLSLADYLHHKSKLHHAWKACFDPTWCFAVCIAAMFRQCLDSMRKFAVVAVALAGGSFCETSKRAMDTLGAQRTADFMVVDSVISTVLRTMSIVFSTAIAVGAWASIDAAENLGIFKSISDGVHSAGGLSPMLANWLVLLILWAFVYFVKRPSFTLGVIVTLNGFFHITQPFIASAMAALVIGAIASLVFNYFASCIIGAQCAMFYCWALEQAVDGSVGAPSVEAGVRAEVRDMWMKQQALMGYDQSQPSAPPPSAHPVS